MHHNYAVEPHWVFRVKLKPLHASTSRVMPTPIVIPACKPGPQFITLVDELVQRGASAIIVVDDGSGPEYGVRFDAVAGHAGVHILRHAVNLGKGAALKTGMNYALCTFPDSAGVVTADADGQHHPDDIFRVARRLEANADCLVLGVRQFSGSVPARSKIGNNLTRVLMRMLMGSKIADTQTGLRGIPARLIPHLLKTTSLGYEFELDMLIACKHQSCRILEEPIATIYLNGNASSHFNPMLDSMRIYFVLLRFSAVSALTALLDNIAFILFYGATQSILQAQAGARCVAMIFNYSAARSAVFHSQQRHRTVLPKYLLLVLANATISYGLIQFLGSTLSVAVIPAKIAAEGLLFIANFAIQRDFVFTRRRSQNGATDWDTYYKSVPVTAKLTRKYTTAVLLSLMKRFVKDVRPAFSIVELGGANSCFLDRIMADLRPSSYDVVDTNKFGLSLLEKRLVNQPVRLHNESVLDIGLSMEADLVFSVGLIEHFEPKATREAILTHFQLLRPGGYAIITFPTPTLLYRVTRFLLEAAGLWKFPDERPLRREEVLSAVREQGQVVYEKVLWPLVLTQGLVVARKSSGAQLNASSATENAQWQISSSSA